MPVTSLPKICMLSIFLLTITNFILTLAEDRCTAFIAGRNATLGGFTINTHTDDCYDCDFRIAQIPSNQQPAPLRPIPPQMFSYPRFIGSHRGSAFYDEFVDKTIFNWTQTISTGTVPEASQTFSYIEGSYAISNEYGVSLGESTCGGKFVSAPIFAGGKALLEISELGKIALERSKTAREAIQIMGDLAVQFGFYTAEWGESDQQEGGEAYTVTDAFEAWVFHIVPTPDGASAVWVAQRVPDNHIAVITNSFIIREIPLPSELDPNTFMFSPNVYTIAIDHKLWDPSLGRHLDFKTTYGWAMPIYREPYVSRRQWRVFSLLAPSLNLSPILTSFELPFSIKPDDLVSFEKVLEIHRDHFEGTPFDTTVGIESGPYGNPNRYDQYEGIENGDDISTILQSLYSNAGMTGSPANMDQVSMPNGSFGTANGTSLASSLFFEPNLYPTSIPHHVLQALSNDDQIFAQFPFAQSTLNFTQYRYTQNAIKQANNIRSNIGDNSKKSPSNSPTGPIGDVLNIDRSQGHPMSDDTLSKGFFERTISLFRTSYSHYTTLLPSSTSLYYPNSTYFQYDPIFIPQFALTSKPALNLSKINYKSPTSSPFPIDNAKPYMKTLLPRYLAYTTYISLHQPSTSTITPIFPALPTQLNQQYTQGSLWKYSQDSAWWKFATVSNYANNYYRFIVRDIQYAQQSVETNVTNKIKGLHRDYHECLGILTAQMNGINTDSLPTVNNANTSDKIVPTVNAIGRQSSEDNILFDEKLFKDIVGLQEETLLKMHRAYNDTRGTVEYISTAPLLEAETQTDSELRGIFKPLSPATQPIAKCLANNIVMTHESAHALSTKLLSTWTELFHHILGRYHDGYRTDNPSGEIYSATPLFYPTSWLKTVRFWRLSLGDPAAGRGFEYLHGHSTGLFTKNYTTPRSQRYYEIDQQFSPGEHCLAPRLYNGSGEVEYIANSYMDRMLLNSGYHLPPNGIPISQSGVQTGISPVSTNNPNIGMSIYDLYTPSHVSPSSSSKAQQGGDLDSADQHGDADLPPFPPQPPIQQPQSQAGQSSALTDLIGLYIIFTIVAVGLILLGYHIGRSSMQKQLELTQQHLNSMQYLVNSATNPALGGPNHISTTNGSFYAPGTANYGTYQTSNLSGPTHNYQATTNYQPHYHESHSQVPHTPPLHPPHNHHIGKHSDSSRSAAPHNRSTGSLPVTQLENIHSSHSSSHQQYTTDKTNHSTVQPTNTTHVTRQDSSPRPSSHQYQRSSSQKPPTTKGNKQRAQDDESQPLLSP